MPTINQSNVFLCDQVALVTGASRGIGLEIARSLASFGCNLVLTGRDHEALTRVSRELANDKIKVLTHTCDVRDPGSVTSLVRAVRQTFKRLDILVNNAGVAHENLTVQQMPYEVWKDVLETNLNGTFLVTQAALGLMKDGGTIVNNLSVAANRVFPGSSAYVASKHGALGFTNALREELRPRKIRVIAVLPGATDTAIWKTLWPDAPRKKMMTAESVARIVTQSILLPANATVEHLEIRPSVGTL